MMHTTNRNWSMYPSTPNCDLGEGETSEFDLLDMRSFRLVCIVTIRSAMFTCPISAGTPSADGLPTGRASERMPDYQKVRGEGWVTGCAVELAIDRKSVV